MTTSTHAPECPECKSTMKFVGQLTPAIFCWWCRIDGVFARTGVTDKPQISVPVQMQTMKKNAELGDAVRLLAQALRESGGIDRLNQYLASLQEKEPKKDA